jgi:hypothetical protein
MGVERSIVGGRGGSSYSCSASFTSFEIDWFYGLWTWIYEYEPTKNIDLPTPMAMQAEISKFNTYPSRLPAGYK